MECLCKILLVCMHPFQPHIIECRTMSGEETRDILKNDQ